MHCNYSFICFVRFLLLRNHTARTATVKRRTLQTRNEGAAKKAFNGSPLRQLQRTFRKKKPLRFLTETYSRIHINMLHPVRHLPLNASQRLEGSMHISTFSKIVEILIQRSLLTGAKNICVCIDIPNHTIELEDDGRGSFSYSTHMMGTESTDFDRLVLISKVSVVPMSSSHRKVIVSDIFFCFQARRRAVLPGASGDQGCGNKAINAISCGSYPRQRYQRK